ncbi:MAG: hypothetical protein ACRD8U_20240 [Pyrinomonadaceae bacterium]
MPARVRIIDFSEDEPGFVGGINVPKTPVKMGVDKQSKKQIRRRVRRRGTITRKEFETLYKPIEEWDMEELARGKPRNSKGDFSGPAPQWMTRAMHEAIMSQFRDLVNMEMRAHTVTALSLVGKVLIDDRVDHKGKPLVSASEKLRAAQFLIEQQVGKPLQRQEVDISVKLQGLLATATVGPVDGIGRAMLASPDAVGFGTMSDFAGALMAGDIEDAEVIDDDD